MTICDHRHAKLDFQPDGMLCECGRFEPYADWFSRVWGMS